MLMIGRSVRNEMSPEGLYTLTVPWLPETSRL